jgi:hypothetical protein
MSAFILLGLLVIGGYVLGIIGFFRAGTALAELRALHRSPAESGAAAMGDGRSRTRRRTLHTGRAHIAARRIGSCHI